MKRFLFAVVLVLMILSTAPLYADKLHDMVEDAYAKIPATLAEISDSIGTVAVFKVTVPEGTDLDQGSLREQFETILIRSRRFTVVERTMLEQLLEEQKLSLTGVINDAQMVRSGELIGVQGFFNLTFARTGDTLTLTVRLIDVQTGGVVYSETFVGESYARTRVGFGAAFVYHPGTESTIGVYENSSASGYVFGEEDLGVIPAMGVQALFSIKAGNQAVKSILFGTDLSFSLYGGLKEFKPPYGEEGGYPGGIDNYGIEHATGLFITLALEPKLYFSLKHIMGLSGDWVNPYLGAGIYLHGAVAQNGGWFNYDSGGSYDGDTESNMIMPLFQISPLVGIEFNLSPSISIYAQGVYHIMSPEDITDNYFGNDSRGI